jgi:ADP-heptose:LPS heptosyltransferase
MRESLVIRSLPLDVAVNAVFRMADRCLGKEFDVLDYGEHAPVWREVALRLGRSVNVLPRQRRIPLIGPWDLASATDKYRNAYVFSTGPRVGLDQVAQLARTASEQAFCFDAGTEEIHSLSELTDVERIDTKCRFLPEPIRATDAADVDLRVIRVDLLGDLVFTIPLLELLKEFFPNKRLSLVVDRRFEEFAKLIRAVDVVEAIDINNVDRFNADLFRIAETTAEWQLLPIGGGWRPDLASFIHRSLPAHRRISRLNFDESDLQPYAASPRQEVVEVASMAMMLRYHTTIDAVRDHMNPCTLDKVFRLGTPSSIVNKLGLGASDLLFAPLGGSAERDWTTAGWAEAAKVALDSIAGRLVLIGNDTARHREFSARLKGLVPSERLVDLTGQTELKDLLQIAARCGGYLGTNTAPMHLIALQGKKAVALNSPFEPVDLWRYPFGYQALVPGQRLLHNAQQSDLSACIERSWRRSIARETEDYFYRAADVAEAVTAVFGRKQSVQRHAS